MKYESRSRREAFSDLVEHGGHMGIEHWSVSVLVNDTGKIVGRIGKRGWYWFGQVVKDGREIPGQNVSGKGPQETKDLLLEMVRRRLLKEINS